MDRSEVEKAINSTDKPKGTVVRASDGRMFFLTDDDVKRTAINPGKLYSAYLHITGNQGKDHHPVDRQQTTNCGAVKKWLDTANPDDYVWRAVCFFYFYECVDEQGEE